MTQPAHAAAAAATPASDSGSAAGQPAPGQPPGSGTERRTQWVSQGVEALFARVPERTVRGQDKQLDADVLIIGSGYGGAVAAQRLAGLQVPGDAATGQAARPLKVVMLERGREYLAGAFPSRAADLPGHLRFTTPHGDGAKGRLEGLFDLRVGDDMTVVLANGVGGGSLINAGVMAFPLQEVFGASDWPQPMPAYKDLRQRSDELRTALGAMDVTGPAQNGTLDRTRFMANLGAHRVPISVASQARENSAGVELKACIGCGDCATGCNHGAKDSLDLNLLRSAQQQGLTLYSGATVTRIRRAGGAWEAKVWHTDATLRKRMARGHWVRATRIILAAGSLGSTEILLRSQTDTLQFSRQLGQGFSGNGDVLAMVYGAKAAINGVADEDTTPDQRMVGPTITSMIDLRATHGVVVQDLGVPGALRRLFEETATTTALLQQLDQPDTTAHLPSGPGPDPVAVDPGLIARSLAVALIYRDKKSEEQGQGKVQGGQMTPVPDDYQLPRDAGLRIAWQSARHDEAIQQAHDTLTDKLAGTGARLLPNPVWQLLPPRVAALLGRKPGPLLTVHPLGGCRMGIDAARGVVNRLGQVWDADAHNPGQLHEGLLVLDGAIVPCALGINPALTIATLADLAMDELIAQWALQRLPTAQPALVARPIFREVARNRPMVAPAKTEVQVVERLAGWVDLPGKGPKHWVEIDLAYQPKALFPADGHSARPAFTQDGHRLPVAVDATLSRVRIFTTQGSPFDPNRPDAQAVLVAPLEDGSHLQFFHREASTEKERRCRTLKAYIRNRGARDTWQALLDKVARRGPDKLQRCERWRQACALASRGGEVRLFDYRLTLGKPSRAVDGFKDLEAKQGLSIQGSKRVSYTRRGNPWSQLMRMELSKLAGLDLGKAKVLEVQPAYFAAKRLPLLRVVAQQDQPSALIDLLTFGAYLARVMLNVHVWSLRKPDDHFFTLPPPQRLPGRLSRRPSWLSKLPAPQVHQFKPDGANDDAEIRLTAYRQPNNSGRGPVLMIHGYSASGTSFAHKLLQPSLARHLWEQGFEPWVLDLRSSSGMPSADRPYTFEEIALVDIPAALHKVCQATGKAQVDVITHCMGSAMLAMTLQSTTPSGPQTAARIGRWVMSQFGPRMRFSPANLLRAYLISYFREALPDYRYSLNPGNDVPGAGAGGSLYDRFISTLPYLGEGEQSEFDVENPWWRFWCRTPWVGTRHRLDALIGRTFDARQMAPAVLDRIDDFFGPINLRTMSQPIFFAQMGEVAGAQGLEPFGRDAAPLLRHAPLLSLHGKTNGLADIETAKLLRQWALRGGLDLAQRCYADHGHQDLLIGRDCAVVFKHISDFLKGQLPATDPEHDCAL